MLTVKHITSDRQESVRLAKEVIYAKSPETGKCVVTAWCLDNATLTFDRGMIYVMNDNGKTVADYELGSDPVAHSN